MPLSRLLTTTTHADAPFDGSAEPEPGKGTQVSEFLTVQALTNFAAMTGAITAAWHALIRYDADMFGGLAAPYTMAGFFGFVSILLSVDALKKDGEFSPGRIAAAIFVAAVNSLVLASAVVGSALGPSAP